MTLDKFLWLSDPQFPLFEKSRRSQGCGVVYTSNASAWEAKAGESVSGQPGLCVRTLHLNLPPEAVVMCYL